MTRLEKLVRRMTARPSEARFDDVRQVLDAYGWVVKRQSGSHCIFSRTGESPLVMPLVAGRTVKRRYPDRICNLLERDDPGA